MRLGDLGGGVVRFEEGWIGPGRVSVVVIGERRLRDGRFVGFYRSVSRGAFESTS